MRRPICHIVPKAYGDAPVKQKHKYYKCIIFRVGIYGLKTICKHLLLINGLDIYFEWIPPKMSVFIAECFSYIYLILLAEYLQTKTKHNMDILSIFYKN